MNNGELSDYSDLTAGQYEGQVMKRGRHYKWRQYWCVLSGRQLTFYDNSEKNQVVGRIEIQPGSRCDKCVGKAKFPSLAELFHREYKKAKKYPLKLKTKKGTHLFTYEDVKEQTRWQLALNNASQENVSGVRLSWVPTPFSMVTTPVENIRSNLSPVEQLCHEDRSPDIGKGLDAMEQTTSVPVTNTAPKTKCKSKRDDTRTLIAESDSVMSDRLAFTNISAMGNRHEMVTSL